MPAFLSVCPDIGHHGNEAPALRPPVLGGVCVRQLEWALGLQEFRGQREEKGEHEADEEKPNRIHGGEVRNSNELLLGIKK